MKDKLGHFMITGILVLSYYLLVRSTLFFSTFITGTFAFEQFPGTDLFAALGFVIFGAVLLIHHILSCRYFQGKSGIGLFYGVCFCTDVTTGFALLWFRDQFPVAAYMLLLIWGLRIAFLLPEVRRYFYGKNR